MGPGHEACATLGTQGGDLRTIPRLATSFGYVIPPGTKGIQPQSVRTAHVAIHTSRGREEARVMEVMPRGGLRPGPGKGKGTGTCFSILVSTHHRVKKPHRRATIDAKRLGLVIMANTNHNRATMKTW